MVAEAHDTHHPVGASLHYEEQRAEARAAPRSSAAAPAEIPGLVRDRAGAQPGRRAPSGRRQAELRRPVAVPARRGLRYAFPKAAAQALAATPRVVALRDRVAALPRVAAYLRSQRRIPFNEQGIFRRYPELDLA